jgi:hypothetical protein
MVGIRSLLKTRRWHPLPSERGLARHARYGGCTAEYSRQSLRDDGLSKNLFSEICLDRCSHVGVVSARQARRALLDL